MTAITNNLLKRVTPASKPLFIRDSILKGFAAKVNPSGCIKFIAEAWYKGKSFRKTIGEFPYIETGVARDEARSFLALIKTGQNWECVRGYQTLQGLLDSYLIPDQMKHSTTRDYRNAVSCYLQDWLNKPVSTITRPMVEKRF